MGWGKEVARGNEERMSGMEGRGRREECKGKKRGGGGGKLGVREGCRKADRDRGKVMRAERGKCSSGRGKGIIRRGVGRGREA